jgi:hypothetical protein
MKNRKQSFVHTAVIGLGLGLSTIAMMPPAMAFNNNPMPQRTSSLAQSGSPYFYYKNGCVSSVAVDGDGNKSGGLKPTGNEGGKCRDTNKMQTYTRQITLDPKNFGGNTTAVMYAQYFLKDMGNKAGKPGGHRHDWEEVVVFFNAKGQATKAVASAHGGYKAIDRSPKYAGYWSGNRPKVAYGVQYAASFLNNSFWFTDRTGETPSMVDWEFLSPQAKSAIASGWDKASPKFVPNTFTPKVKEAWQARGF